MGWATIGGVKAAPHDILSDGGTNLTWMLSVGKFHISKARE